MDAGIIDLATQKTDLIIPKIRLIKYTAIFPMWNI